MSEGLHEPSQELFAAIHRGEIDAALTQLAGDPGLAGARDCMLGGTPLHFAAHRGQLAVVTALLDAGADVHAREAVSDTTALHWAAEVGSPPVIAALLARGAELEVRDGWFSLTPLGWASVVCWAPERHQDRAAAARRLREAGAQEDIFVALVEGRMAAVRALVEADAGELARRLGFVGSGMTPLHLAAARGLAGAVPVLVELGADLQARTGDGLTPLALALQRGDAELVRGLRALGAEDEVASALVVGDLAGLRAALVARPTGPELLIQLLAAAAGSGRVEAIGALVDHGAEVDGRTRRLLGETPAEVTALHLAALEGHAEAVRVLLAAGAAVEGRAGPGSPTPLHVAAGKGHMEVVRVLLGCGADREAREAVFSATPLQWAEFCGHQAVAALLRGG